MKIIKESTKIVENNVKSAKDLLYGFNDGLTRIKNTVDFFLKEKLSVVAIDIGNSFEKLSFRNVKVKLFFKEDLFEELEQSDFNRIKKIVKSSFNINLITVDDSNELIISVL